ncbi:MAG: glucosaminidase domain-containing protein [Chloroflexota bacterium]|nr:glucosaminidase domain-containing protein [Chloroflexota bacterium]
MSFAFRHKRSPNPWLLGLLLVGVLGSGLLAGRLGATVAQARAGLHLSNYRMIIGPSGVKAANAVIAPAPAPTPAGLASTVARLPPADPHSVIGPATISAALIDTILGEYGSPAAGQGATFVALGAQYGIDPAFALAFYVQESHCGTRGVARFTHGIGNIRWTAGFAGYEGYRAYPDYAAGIHDWFQLIRTLYVDGWGLQTVATIVPRYAPAGDGNDPAGYTATVEALVATWRDRQLSAVGRQ